MTKIWNVGVVGTGIGRGHIAEGYNILPNKFRCWHCVTSIENPPFFTIPICASITSTMGGIAIDGHGRVKRANSTTIDGLYAAGRTIGGLEGGGALGYVTG